MALFPPFPWSRSVLTGGTLPHGFARPIAGPDVGGHAFARRKPRPDGGAPGHACGSGNRAAARGESGATAAVSRGARTVTQCNHLPGDHGCGEWLVKEVKRKGGGGGGVVLISSRVISYSRIDRSSEARVLSLGPTEVDKKRT